MKQNDDRIRSAPRAPVPAVRTSFVGRKQEMEEVGRLLASSRLVTLTGAAGCGKTRLAMQAAKATVGKQFADGVAWVELARLNEAALVAQTAAKALGAPEQAERPALAALLEALQERDLLLVLDNCEHLLSACSELAERVLAETTASVLATSREPLGVRGEKLYPVAPLSLPPRSPEAEGEEGLAQIAECDAVRLFVERARTIAPAFTLTTENAGAVAEICRELEGIPLAIELASARLNVLTAEQIAERLDDHFGLLPAATHVTYSHHETLRGAIVWSHDLLSKAEQVLLRRLSVCAGGCSLRTAQAVCAGGNVERERVLELLSSLVNKSLLVADTLQRSEARYRLLEPIRQYAEEKLTAASERPALRDRHLERFVQLAEETEPKLKGAYQQLWLNWLEEEYDNIRAALAWALEGGRIEAGLRIAVAIYQFWTIRDYVEEASAWLERLLARVDESVSPAVHAHALAYAAFLAGFRGNTKAQRKYGERAAELVASLGEAGRSTLTWIRAGEAYAEGRPGPLSAGRSALVWALSAQAYGARAAGDHQTELELYQWVIDLHREAGNKHDLGVALTTASFAAMSLGKYDEARALLDEGMPLVREMGDPYRIAMSLNFSGDLARCQGDYDRAEVAYEESISLLSELEAARDLASALHNLGHTCLHLGDAEQADSLFRESIALQQAQGNEPGVAECLIGFAALAITSNMPAAGARLLAAAVAIGGERVATAWEATRMEYERYLEQAREGLTERAFQAEQAAGSALYLEQAVAYAEEVGEEAVQRAAAAERAQRKLDALTPREREVAALIAQAKSNPEIAEELVISKRTVETHVSNIRSKLHFTKRAEIVRWALEEGLAEAG